MLGFNSISELIMFTIVITISLVLHEFSHGLVSYLQGDSTPKDQGRLTLNPAAHIDPFGLLAIYIIHFGWAKPVMTSSKNYKNRRLGIILTSIAGPLSNLILAFLSAIILALLNPQNQIVDYFFVQLIEINIILAIFNFIPIPPLDGSKIFAQLFGGRIAELIYSLNRIGMVIVFLILMIPPVNNAYSVLINYIFNAVINAAYLVVR